MGVFDQFIGMQVKAPYKDGKQLKVARGTLAEITGGFVKINGKLGTIVIKQSNIQKMASLKAHFR